MKRYIVYILALVAVASVMSSCKKDEPDKTTSVITVGNTYRTELDDWLDANYLLPYNINFQYRYLLNESDIKYYTVPASYNNSVIMAHLVKHLCVDTYDEIAGLEFTRTYFPKMFFLIGSWEYNPNGTIRLGTAEGGKKIILSGINNLTSYMTSAANLNHYYIKTIHHEFTHILNQTKPYPADYMTISAGDYVADDWNSFSDANARKMGFITNYSMKEDREDFAEVASEYITNTPEQWDAYMATAASGENSAGVPGDQVIAAKLKIVKDYFNQSYSIDLDRLRDIILRRQDEVLGGLVDLTDCTVK